MPSLQFYLMKPLMRFMHWQQARFPVHDVNAFVKSRTGSDRMADRMMHPPRGVVVQKSIVGGVPGDWLILESAPEDPVIVYLHGGGILYTWSAPFRRVTGYLAKYSGLRAFGVDYRLVPEHVYPAAHDDCFNVYKALVEQGKQVVLVGDSSGGVLALATMLRAKAAGLPQPPLCVLLSPTVDYGFKDDGIWRSKDPFIPTKFPVEMHKHYVAGNDTMMPDLGPIYADLSGLPPIYIMAAQHDMLRTEVERFAIAAKKYNVKVEVVFWPHVWHGWYVLASQLPEATEALKMVGEVIHDRTSPR